MFAIVSALLHALIGALRPRASLVVEILVLRQQLAVLKRDRPRPPLRPIDRAFWVVVFRVWSRWSDALAIVKPATVIAWHRRGFRRFWAWKSRRVGRPPLAPEAFDHRVDNLGLTQLRIAPRSPWQNGFAERWVGTARREIVDHVIVLGERHLRRIFRAYVAYYNGDRPHMSLAGDAPMRRDVEPPSMGRVVAMPKLGGLHHRYGRVVA